MLVRKFAGGYAACALNCVAALGAAGAALAQPYPHKPIRLIVPYPPSGGSDTIGRPLAQKMCARRLKEDRICGHLKE
ncbi:MAG: hypothetical protein ACREVR_20515 [Burkholderiales bacterium]